MARLVSLDEIDSKLRNYLMSTLRVCDEAAVLPQASRSIESGALKNIVLRLNGTETGVSPELFSPNWFCGVSLVKIPNDKAEVLLSSDAKRAAVLKSLVEAIPSEMQDSQLQVGPELEGDAQDRDTASWTPGFDGPGCCTGLYSAMQNKSPEAFQCGMNRIHNDYYILAKAGAGVAGQTFHARLTNALKEGKTLDEALAEDGVPGACALRRVASAAKRNRARIILKAAEALRLYGMDTLGDNASPAKAPHRVAIPTIDSVYNTLIRVESSQVSRSTWQYAAGACDAAVSTGIVVSSNVAEGFVAFVSPSGDRLVLKNEAYSCLPFSTPRIMTNRDAVFKAVEAHKKAKRSGGTAHPDHAWTKTHFGWQAKDFGHCVDIEPPCLWGSHESETFLAEWSRELGVSRASPVRLQPEIVSVAAVEPGKLRVATKAVATA